MGGFHILSLVKMIFIINISSLITVVSLDAQYWEKIAALMHFLFMKVEVSNNSLCRFPTC